MKNKKKICVVATIIATILLIHSCSKGESQGETREKFKINKKYEEKGNKKEAKTKIDNLEVGKADNKILVGIPKKIKLNKKVVSEKRKTKEKFYISPKKEAVKENIKEPIKTKIVIEKKESISNIEKTKQKIILLFGNFNFFNRDHRTGYKENKIAKPEKPLRPINEFDPITPEVQPIIPDPKPIYVGPPADPIGGGYLSAINGSTGINIKIKNINNSFSFGMRADNKSTIINKGTLNLNGDSSIGLMATNNSVAINDKTGTINLNSTNGTGIYVDETSIFKNDGVINLKGDSGNVAINNNGYLYNSGEINVVGTFNLENQGKMIMERGGTIEADEIKGNIYASGALAMGGYDDTYSTYKMLKTTNLEGDVISNSAMFDAHFTENKDENGFYDVVLDRKDFNTVVSNEKLGEILENNYKDNGNELKEDYYDALKLVSTEKGLDKAVEDSYGMSSYPTLAKQTFEIAKDSNQVIVDQVLNNTKVRKTGETIAIAGVNTTKLKNDSYSNVSGYDTDLYSVYLGAEKQLNKDTRIGGIITIGKANIDYKDVEGSRDDYYYQGNIYYTYENDERLKFTSMIYGGITDTSLERTLAFGSLNETMKDDINNYYIGLNNELSKKYYFNRNYLKPKFELNFTYMNQDDISESGDQGLKIDGVNSTSIETGLGLALGRDFYIDNGSKVNLEGSMTGYAELGNPYKDLNSIFKTLSTDKVKIEGYNNDDFYGDIILGGSYETKKSLKIFTKLGYRIGNDSDGFIGNIGMNYLF